MFWRTAWPILDWFKSWIGSMQSKSFIDLDQHIVSRSLDLKTAEYGATANAIIRDIQLFLFRSPKLLGELSVAE